MICPNCHNEVSVTEKDFGALFNCPKCLSAYFINFEGQPEYSDALPEENISSPVDNPVDLPSEPADTNQQMPSFEPISTFEDNNFDAANSFTALEVGAEPFSIPTNEPALAAAVPDFNSSNFSNVAAEISDFGNSETQIASLNYDLKVSGLDSKEDILAFKELIEDSRFAWDVSELMKQIKNGEIYLQKLNPVQAYILAKRLHFLDVEMKWKQNVLQ